MRAELLETEQIEQYLLNEMSTSERAGFEKELAKNPDLKAKVDAQQTVMDLVEHFALKQSAKSSFKSYKIKALITKTIITLVILGAVGAIGFFGFKYLIPEEGSERYSDTAAPVGFVFDDNDSLSSLSNQFLDKSIFTINTETDTIVENQDGVVIYIPANAFDTDRNEVELLVQSAIHAEDIMYAGLSTTSNGDPLETGGMFYIDANADGKRVNLVKELTVNVPTNDKKPDMQLYEGVKTAEGDINWVKPKPIETDLIPVDITGLDFYPPEYENTMNSFGHSQKAVLDSVYYSFAFDNHPATINNFSPKLGEKPLEQNEATHAIEPQRNNYQQPKSENLQTSAIEMPNSVYDVIKWDFKTDYLGNNTYDIVMTAHQIDGWHIYSQVQPEGGASYPTRFEFSKSDKYKLIGNTREYGTVTHGGKFPERIFDGDKAVFKQRVQVNAYCNVTINYEFMACLEACFAPEFATMVVSLNPIDSLSLDLDDTPGINPASVKTIWSKKFNNTILATTEFEARMPWIHQSCNQRVLDLYVNNLTLGLSEIDELVIPLVGGEVQQAFNVFSKKGHGRVKQSSRAAKKLSRYYDKKRKAYAKALAMTEQQYWRDQQKQDLEHMNNTRESKWRAHENKTEVYQKELEKNLQKVYRKLNYTKPEPASTSASNTFANLDGEAAEEDSTETFSLATRYISPPPRATYQVRVVRMGWCNIDRAIAQTTMATKNRQNLTIINGNTSLEIAYNKWTGKVNNHQDFGRIYVYNLPKTFNSYVKLPGRGGQYHYKLNADVNYTTMVLAWTKTDLFFAEQVAEAGTQEFELKAISKAEFDQKIKNSRASVNDLGNELEFIRSSQKHETRIRQNIKRKALRRRVEPVIFPCGYRETAVETVNAIPSNKSDRDTIASVASKIVTAIDEVNPDTNLIEAPY